MTERWTGEKKRREEREREIETCMFETTKRKRDRDREVENRRRPIGRKRGESTGTREEGQR